MESGTIQTANLIGGRGTMSGGYVGRWSLFAESTLLFSGGEASYVETAGLDTRNDPSSALLVVAGGKIEQLDATGNVVVRGGSIGEGFVFRGGGTVEITGGTVGNGFQVGATVVGAIPNSSEPLVVGSGGRVAVSGGSVGHQMVLYAGRTLDFSGGTIGELFQASRGSQVNIVGSQFALDGVPLTAPVGGRTVPIEARNVSLTGRLARGEAFAFELYDIPGRGDYFFPRRDCLRHVRPRTNIGRGAAGAGGDEFAWHAVAVAVIKFGSVQRSDRLLVASPIQGRQEFRDAVG